ncbi:hypothetical protein [Noviherbaspirillum denitrificans]|nr:hypothetical protein [Noviherbaspirillum denitrificans]
MSGATEESKGAGKALEALGINFNTFKNLSPDQQMRTIAESMNKFEDGSGKAAVAMALLGKEGAQMLPFMKDLAETADLQAKITTEQAAAADNFGDNLTKLTSSGGAWKKELAVGMIPALNIGLQAFLDVTNGTGGLREEIRRLSADGSIARWTQNAITGATYVMDAFAGVKRVVLSLGEIIGAVAAKLGSEFTTVAEVFDAVKRGDFSGALKAFEAGGVRGKAIWDGLKQTLDETWSEETLGQKLRARIADMAAAGTAAEGVKKKLDFTNINDKDKDKKESISDYQKLVATLKEKISVQEMELRIDEKATDGQKLLAKVNADLENNTISLTEKEEARVRQLLDTLVVSERNVAIKREMAKASNELIAVGEKEVKKVQDELEKQREHNAEIGLSKEQIADLIAEKIDLEAASDREAAAALRAAADYAGPLHDAYLQYAADLERAAAAKNKLANAKRDGAAKQVLADEAEEAAKEWTKFNDSVRQGLTDSLYRGFEAGKGFFKSFWDGIRNYVKTNGLKFAIQGVMSGVMGGAGAASAATAGAAGEAGALGNVGGIMSGIGALAGNFGSGISAGFAQLTAGVNPLSALSSALDVGAGSLSTALGQVAGYLGPIALGIGAVVALVKHLDDSGTKHTGGAARSDQFGTALIDARSLGFMDIATAKESEAMVSGLASSIAGILNSTAETFGKSAGYSAATAFADDTSKDGAWGALLVQKMGQTLIDWDSNRQSRWAPREFNDGEAGRNEYLAALSRSVRDALNDVGLPDWAKSMLDQLGDSPALADLATVVDKINATQRALVIMGDTLKGFANLSDKAVSTLIKAAGGIDALASAAGSYYDNFYSDEEKRANTMKQIADVLQEVGLTVPETKKQFRALVDAEMALGEAGAPAVAALLKVSGAFATMMESAEKVSKPTLDKAMGAVDGAFSALQRAVQAQKDTVAKAYEDAMARLSVSIDTVNGRIGKLSSLASSLKSTVDRMRLPADSAAGRAQASAQIAAALAIARAGGVLPDADVLAGALDTVAQPNEQLYATLTDFRRDFMRDRNNIEELAGLTDAQLSVEEKTLKALEDQKKATEDGYRAETQRLDDIVNSAKQQIDVLRGIDTSIMSVADALTSFKSTIAGATVAGATGGGANSAVFGGSGYGAGGGYGGAANGQGATDKLSAVERLYATFSDMSYLTEEGGAYWAGQFNKGIPLPEIEQAFRDSVKAVRGYASGGDKPAGIALVGEDGPEIINTGAARIFNAAKTQEILSGGSAVLAGAVERLTQKVEQQQAALERIAASSNAQESFFRRISPDGASINVTVTA